MNRIVANKPFSSGYILNHAGRRGGGFARRRAAADDAGPVQLPLTLPDPKR